MITRSYDAFPVLGSSIIDTREVRFAWLFDRPILRLTFSAFDPPLIGQVTHLDGLPRLVTVPANHGWVQADRQRTASLLDRAIEHYRRRDDIFRHCDG